MLSAALLVLNLVSAAPVPGTLAGRVLDDQGMPLAGARVGLYSAKPRTGLPVSCPSCYRDCDKSATTDAEGRFSIGEIDRELLFRVLAMASGRRALLTDWIDPAQTELRLKLGRTPAELPPDRMLKGRVVDAHGKPLAGAIVSPVGAKTRDNHWRGHVPGVENAAITDEEGRFAIISQESKIGLDLEVKARGYADFLSPLLDRSQQFYLDGSEHEIRMRRGASVSGRLTYEGKPARRHALGIVLRDRSAGRFVEAATLATGEDGGFLFVDLQPNEPYAIYSLCDGKRESPVLKTVSLQTGGDSERTELGELSLRPGLTLAGRVEIPAGAKMPDGAKLRVSRDPAWDWCETPISDNGDFAIRGLPPEVYRVSVLAAGFEIDAGRMRYQTIGASEFALRLRGDGEARLVEIAVPMKR